jgi:hypothetical protein
MENLPKGQTVAADPTCADSSDSRLLGHGGLAESLDTSQVVDQRHMIVRKAEPGSVDLSLFGGRLAMSIGW